MKNPYVVAIIQARMGSTRLPGKVLKPLGDRSMLAYLVERISVAKTLDSIMVATSVEPCDEVVVGAALRLGVPVFRGSETDVLDRYVKAGRAGSAHIVVRVTADNPFTDPASIDRAVNCVAAGFDYAIESDMPVGTTGEALTLNALDFIHRVAWTDAWREHVTLFAKENPHMMRCAFLNAPKDVARSDMSFTVDRTEDYEYVQALCSRLPGPHFSLKELITLADTGVRCGK